MATTTDKKAPIEAEIVKAEPAIAKAVSVTPKQLRTQMLRDQELRQVINEYIASNMVEGKDYGSIEVKKGTGIMSKPSLLKPGAEKFCGLFKIRATFHKDDDTLTMLGNTPGIIAYICELVDTQGRVIGEGRGTAKADINGADFDINKQVKIAQKRAQVDAVLRAGGLSDFFTQDMEDAPRTINTQNYSHQQRLATDKQKALIRKKLNEFGTADEDMKGVLIEEYGITDTAKMTMDDASRIIEDLTGASK